jgi:chromosome segregation ATPase
MAGEIGRRWLVGAVVLAAVASVSGQSAVPARQDDVLTALLGEVRGLRAAMEQLASAGPRVQLFASRLQLQEGRMNNMVRRLDTVRDSLAAAQREVARLQADQGQMEAVAAEQKASASAEAREEARQAEFMLVQLRRQLTGARATESRHAAEEAQLVQDLTTEQGRWLAINQQLDELERTLAKR